MFFLDDEDRVQVAQRRGQHMKLGFALPQVKRYTERRETPFDHQRDIRRAYEWKDFADVEDEFAAWVAARSWMSGDGPKAIFTDGWGGCGSGRCCCRA